VAPPTPARGAPPPRHALETPRALADRLRGWARATAAEAALRPTLPAVRNEASAPASDAIGATRIALAHAAHRALARRQLLCALRETPYGSVAANVAIERALREAWQVPADAEWYAGRAIIVTRNDYAAGLFNGDVGLCLIDDADHLQVWFEAAPGRGAALRAFAPNALPQHESAFAITIHKSQGSEYADVAVLLPPDADNRILSRQLLYTAVSRARSRVELWASDAVLRAALAHPIERQGGLRERLLAGTTGVDPIAKNTAITPAASPQLGFEF
jgi:exodeoxyribonuclease V alpha subunit